MNILAHVAGSQHTDISLASADDATTTTGSHAIVVPTLTDSISLLDALQQPDIRARCIKIAVDRLKQEDQAEEVWQILVTDLLTKKIQKGDNILFPTRNKARNYLSASIVRCLHHWQRQQGKREKVVTCRDVHNSEEFTSVEDPRQSHCLERKEMQLAVRKAVASLSPALQKAALALMEAGPGERQRTLQALRPGTSPEAARQYILLCKRKLRAQLKDFADYQPRHHSAV